MQYVTSVILLTPLPLLAQLPPEQHSCGLPDLGVWGRNDDFAQGRNGLGLLESLLQFFGALYNTTSRRRSVLSGVHVFSEVKIVIYQV